jgi:hypothetical protein
MKETEQLRAALQDARQELASLSQAFEKGLPKRLQPKARSAAMRLEKVYQSFFGRKPMRFGMREMAPSPDEAAQRERTEREIWREIYEAVAKLGGDVHLLAIIGSMKDTMPDDELLLEPAAWNETYPGKVISPARYTYKELLRNAITARGSLVRRRKRRLMPRQTARRRRVTARDEIRRLPRSRRRAGERSTRAHAGR